jgi:hypothetical protein
MPIELNCDCGRALRVKDTLAGKKIRCPECQSILKVPSNEADPNDLGLEVLPDEDGRQTKASSGARRAAIQTEPPEVRPARRRDEEDETPRPRRRDEEDETPRPRRPKRNREIKRGGPSVSFEPGWFGSVNAGVIGGILMMAIAVVWFVVGLAAGYIFFYPPILFVVGIIAIVKGGLGSN